MNEQKLKRLLDKPQIVDGKIEFYIKKKALVKQEFDEAEMKKRGQKDE